MKLLRETMATECKQGCDVESSNVLQAKCIAYLSKFTNLNQPSELLRMTQTLLAKGEVTVHSGNFRFHYRTTSGYSSSYPSGFWSCCGTGNSRGAQPVNEQCRGSFQCLNLMTSVCNNPKTITLNEIRLASSSSLSSGLNIDLFPQKLQLIQHQENNIISIYTKSKLYEAKLPPPQELTLLNRIIAKDLPSEWYSIIVTTDNVIVKVKMPFCPYNDKSEYEWIFSPAKQTELAKKLDEYETLKKIVQKMVNKKQEIKSELNQKLENSYKEMQELNDKLNALKTQITEVEEGIDANDEAFIKKLFGL